MKLLKHLGIAFLFMVAMFFFRCFFGLILSKLHEIHKAILNKGSADPDTLFIDRDQNPKGD